MPSLCSRLLGLTVAVLALGVLAPSMASASVVDLRFRETVENRYERFDVYDLQVSGDPGEANRMRTGSGWNAVRVEDTGAMLRVGENCELSGGAATCAPPIRGVISTVRIDLGDGDDVLDAAWASLISGGPGDDRLISSSGPLFDGGPGADHMESQAPMLSFQRFYGRLSYEGRMAPVSVSVDDGANDGEADEGDDVRGLFSAVIGGEGPDTLTATRGPNSLSLEGRGGGDRLIGGESDDRLVGGPGDDVLIGAAGTDTLEGGLGGDWLSGGPGVEWVRYEDRSAPVSVTLDDRPGDGEAGEGDDVRSDIENVSGGTAGDVIVGSAGPNQLRGGAGDDTLIGGEGADTLLSGSGSNVMEGGPGTDKLYSETRGNRVGARDGERDTIECFLRPPVLLRADPIDSLSRCAPAIGLASRGPLRATKEWTVSFRVGCLGPRINGSCLGVVSIRPEADEEIWAKGAVRLRAGERRRLTLSLRPAGRRALASGKTLRVRAVAVTRAFGRGPSERPRIQRVLLQPPVRR